MFKLFQIRIKLKHELENKILECIWINLIFVTILKIDTNYVIIYE